MSDIPLVPYVIDHHQRERSAADLSFLLDAPAGRDGFIRIHDGHLVTPDGERLRIWGVNLTGWTSGSALLPPKDEVPVWADTLARFGINCVRFHFLDLPRRDEAEARPSGLIDPEPDHTQSFDAEQLDRLDFFVSELKQRGIYTNLNLNVGRTYKPGDEVPDGEAVRIWKGMTFIGERLIELQKSYARDLLTHRNPYTGNEYACEPAVAIVEIVNENSLYEFWMRNWLRGERRTDSPDIQLDFPPFYARQLDAMYQGWLAENRTEAQLAELRDLAGVEAGEAVPRLRAEQFAEAPAPLFHAEGEFYGAVERTFFLDMKRYLTTELGVESLIVGCADHTYWIPNQPIIAGTSQLDIVDGHVYWQHPAIWGARNTPMVNDPLSSTIVKLSRSPVEGKPFTVSEVNHPNPNEYAAEMIPILAAYAAFQDWDGIFFYTFEPKLQGQYQHQVADNFDITLDPVKMIQMAAGALIFSRADVQPAHEIVTRSYSAAQVLESMRLPESARPYFTPGFPVSTALRHGLRISSLDGEPTADHGPEAPGPYLADTGELGWFVEDERGGLVTIDTDRTQALVGFVTAHARTTRHLAAEVANEFCALTLSALDDRPIARSERLLLTACARIENTGTRWNARRTLWETWGESPTLIEPVTGWLVLTDLQGPIDIQVTPLDGSDRPIGEPLHARRLEIGWEIPLGDPATTQYLLHPVRSAEQAQRLAQGGQQWEFFG
ncbi:hypothetical protein IM660_18345 [Ruania alkalisoli]|uniref:Glycoside hydrolase family 42 N-terminal domain-containing protein n=1 Tax=Ruania alkalisoli TaxID=2779775 RepID=A0A7M1SV85_9MICO|nr:hypothetical protein [Ruania alkalisoli]QOR70523.1 hypothetical protein IM660_18345 [Ruania alkalisoli]